MPRNRKNKGIFDSHGLPKPIIEAVQTTARNTPSVSVSAGTRLSLEYPTTPKQRSRQNVNTLTQSTLMPEITHGLTYTVRGRTDSLEHISALKRTCKSMARYLEENPVQSFYPAAPVDSDEIYRTNRGGRVLFLQPITTLKGLGSGKTYGFIRFEGGDVKFKAVSGWGKRQDDADLRDNEFWSSAVLQFCNSLGFRLPAHCWDKTEIGKYAACHVEKKLILMLICHTIYDFETKDIAMFRLEELRERRLRAQIYLDKDPCGGCRKFALELEQVTGIHFEIITAKTVVEAECVKKNGKKQLQAKYNSGSQLFHYSTRKTRPRKPTDYSIPEIQSVPGGKRKRMLDDDDDDDNDDETFYPKDLRRRTKKSYENPRKVDKVNKISKTQSNSMASHLEQPSPTYNTPKDLASNTSHLLSPQQRSTEANAKSTKFVSPTKSTTFTKGPSPRGTLIARHSIVPNGHAVPSERSRAIAELQAKKGLVSRPANHNLPVFHCVQSTEVYTDDLDSVSSGSSRTASPERVPIPVTPPSRAIKALPTPETTPLRRYAEKTHRAPLQHSSNHHVQQTVTPSKSSQKSYRRTPPKPAVSNPPPVSSRTIDLTTPEPSPILQIQRYQYKPPSKPSKHRSEKKARNIPFKLSYNKN